MFSSRTLQSDPLRNFKFNVAIPQQYGGNNSTTGGPSGWGMIRLGFMQVQGLGLQIEPLTYREGGDNITVRKLPGQADFNPVTMTRGLFPTDFDNWYWMSLLFSAMYGGANPIAIANAPSSIPNTVIGSIEQYDFRTPIYINVLDHPNNSANSVIPITTSGGLTEGPYNDTYPQQDNIIKLSIKLYSAWIGGINYSDLDAGGNAVGVEQMSINYEGFDVRWGGEFSSGYVPFNYIVGAGSW